jgi:4-hydroxybenzoyl-CoA thioesterase/acyl-CoA thioester hydrolase
MKSEFHTKRRIEFVDCDLAGFVHFSRFFVFMETAEHEFLRSLGTSVHTQIDGNEIGWPRLAASCEYIQPAKFEDVLDIHLRVKRKGRTSMTYEFFFRKGTTLIAQGQVSSICCKIDLKNGLQPMPIPLFLSKKIKSFSKKKQ